mmetsp:Transcript_21499/g.47696  ORF Transcript_21499/g.47696 Transcript_21499/m.47696 type:complete len:411 (-) Transcript_21499:329-1561(-)
MEVARLPASSAAKVVAPRWNRARGRQKQGEGAIEADDAPAAANGEGGGKRCPICLETPPPDEDPLQCGHEVCADCVGQYLESRIGEGRVASAELCCPLPGCRMAFSEDFIERILKGFPGGPELHARLLDFQARRFELDPAGDERLLNCPSAGCGKVIVHRSVVERAEAVSCPTCSRKFCGACCQAVHPGASCESAEAERMDPELKALMAQEHWKRCPSCRSLCERECGCNFMTCPSESCQGRTHFCYLCGELLTKADHAAHYEGFSGALGRVGPFGSVCLNRRTVNQSLPSRPPAPKLSVVEGQDEGTIALRITWGPHRSEPPTIYYRVQLTVPGSEEVKHLSAQAGQPYHDMHSRSVPKYRRYQASVTPVNVNGAGPMSEPSDVVHFHRRELETAPEPPPAPKERRWAR